MDAHVKDPHSTTPSEAEGVAAPTPGTTSAAHALGALPRRRPLPRKGHKKSRRGCLTCKQRKVKCDEGSGKCGPCRRLGLPCQYVASSPRTTEATNSSPSASPAPPGAVSTAAASGLRLQPGQVTFGMDDLMFFQHFLFSAYPSLPADGWPTWQKAGQMAHQYEFLAHAMLGLGAAHLGVLNGQKYTEKALRHRVQAIRAINQRLSESNLAKAEADAIFASILSLTWQSAYMEDGMVDFFSMVRGCFIIGYGVLGDFSNSLFENLTRLGYVGRLKEISSCEGADQMLNTAVAARLRASLDRLAPLCTSVAELDYLARMQRITALATSDPIAAYIEHSYLFDRLSVFSPEEFESLMNPNNHTSRLILMHLLALDLVLTRMDMDPTHSSTSNRGGDLSGRSRSMSMVWASVIYKSLPPEFCQYATCLVELQAGVSITFSKDDEIWTPFLLHEGTARVLCAENMYSTEVA